MNITLAPFECYYGPLLPFVRCIDTCWQGMVWNGNLGMEDANMKWIGRFQKWNGRQSSIPIPYYSTLLDFAHDIYRKIYTGRPMVPVHSLLYNDN